MHLLPIKYNYLSDAFNIFSETFFMAFYTNILNDNTIQRSRQSLGFQTRGVAAQTSLDFKLHVYYNAKFQHVCLNGRHLHRTTGGG